MEKELRVGDLREVMKKLRDAEFNEGDWKDLGMELGLHKHTLGAITAKNQGNFHRCLTECLTKWLERADKVDKCHGRPTFTSLNAALTAIEKGPVAERINIILGGMFEGNSSEGKKPAKSTRQKTDSPATKTSAGNKDGGPKARASDDEPDGPTPPQDSVNVNEWLKECTVDLTVKHVLMHGLPGSGKTCSQRLLLNKDRPEEAVTDSTPIACRAVKATRISANDNRMEEINVEALLSSLAHDLKEAAPKQKKSPPEDHSTESMEESSENETSESEIEDAADMPDDIEANKIIDEIVEAIPKAKGKFDSNWVYFIDSGGQTAFQELLPLFTRASSLNIITLDLSKGIDDKPNQKYRINGEPLSQIDENSAGDSKPFSYTNIEFIKYVLSSGAILQPYHAPQPNGSEENTSTGSATPQCPGYFVLGTHKDKANKGVIEKYNDELKKLKLGSGKKGYRIIPAELNGGIIYPVNTMLESGPEREDEAKKLCKIIYNEVSGKKIPIPVRWFAFELTLLKKAKRKGRSFLPMNDVLRAGKRLQMTDNQTKEALEYLHDNTMVLYYPQVLQDVFVDPHPILDILSRLLALVTYQIPQKHLDHFVEDTSLLYELEEDLKFRGLFTKKFLENLKGGEDFSKSDFIKLLLHLHIIVETDVQDEYFLPSALPPRPKTSQPPKSDIDPLQIIWRSPETKQDFQILPVPRGIFPLVIVNLMKCKRQPIFRFPPKDQKDLLRYRDAMSFHVRHQKNYIGTVHIIKKHKHIEIYFEGDALKYCSLICEAVKEAIASSCKAINIKPDGYEFAFACSSKKGCYRIVINEDEKKVECTLPGPISPTNSGKEQHWSWFDKTQSSTEERSINDGSDSSFPVQTNTDREVLSNTGQSSAQVNQPPTTGGGNSTVSNSTQTSTNSFNSTNTVTAAEEEENEPDDVTKGIEFLLMTATDPELKEVLEHLKPLDGHHEVIEQFRNGVDIYIGKYGKHPVVVGQSAPTKSQQGSLPALVVTNKIMKIFKPKYIVAIGVCFGMDEKVNLGDVIVSDCIADLYNIRMEKVDTEKGRMEEGCLEEGHMEESRINLHIKNADKAGGTLVSLFRKYRNFEMIKPSDKGNAEKVKVHCGPMVSSPALVDDPEFKEKIRKACPDALGGEMEGAGIFEAAKNHKVEAIVVKAVGDLADGKKIEYKDWKPFACQAAAEYVLHHLECFSSSPDSVQRSTPLPNEGSCSEEEQNPKNSHRKNPPDNRKWVYYVFVIFLAVGAVLAGVAINRFVMEEKNTNDVEKLLTIMTHIATGALPAQPHQYSTTVNPYSDGAGQLGIEDADKVLMVLNKALFAPAKWDDLGLRLGLLILRLNVIEGSGGDAYKHLRKTIVAWLMGADNAKSRTWQTLIDAVREAGDRAAAERIPEELKSLYNITL